MHSSITYKYEIEIDGQDKEFKVEVKIEDLLCPISNKTIENPVLANDGYIYDQAALIKYIENCIETSEPPLSPKAAAIILVAETLITDYTLKGIIEDFDDKNPSENVSNPFIDKCGGLDLITDPVCIDDGRLYNITTLIRIMKEAVVCENGLEKIALDIQRAKSPFNRQPIENWRRNRTAQGILDRFYLEHPEVKEKLSCYDQTKDLINAINEKDIPQLVAVIQLFEIQDTVFLRCCFMGFKDGALIAGMFKAQIAVVDQDNRSGLILAAMNDQADIVEWLLARGANIDDNRSGATAAITAAIHKANAVLQFLINSKANLAPRTSLEGNTALMAACQVNNEVGVKLLLEATVDHPPYINWINYSGNTALHLAAIQGYTNLIPLLLEYKASQKLTNIHGQIAYLAAVANNQTACLAPLRADSDFDYCTDATTGETALHIAAESNQVQSLNWLLENTDRAVLECGYGPDGITPLAQAIFHKAPQAALAILPYCSQAQIHKRYGRKKLNLLAISAIYKVIDLIEPLVKLGLNIEDMSLGSTPLIRAAADGDILLVKKLVELGANVNAVSVPAEATALFMAAQQGHTDIVEFLLKNKANPHCYAYILGNFWAQDVIYSVNGIPQKKYTKKTPIPCTPLMQAIMKGHSAAANLLIEANSVTCFMDGKLDLVEEAKKNNMPEIAEFISYYAGKSTIPYKEKISAGELLLGVFSINSLIIIEALIGRLKEQLSTYVYAALRLAETLSFLILFLTVAKKIDGSGSGEAKASLLLKEENKKFFDWESRQARLEQYKDFPYKSENWQEYYKPENQKHVAPWEACGSSALLLFNRFPHSLLAENLNPLPQNSVVSQASTPAVLLPSANKNRETTEEKSNDRRVVIA